MNLKNKLCRSDSAAPLGRGFQTDPFNPLMSTLFHDLYEFTIYWDNFSLVPSVCVYWAIDNENLCFVSLMMYLSSPAKYPCAINIAWSSINRARQVQQVICYGRNPTVHYPYSKPNPQPLQQVKEMSHVQYGFWHWELIVPFLHL